MSIARRKHFPRQENYGTKQCFTACLDYFPQPRQCYESFLSDFSMLCYMYICTRTCNITDAHTHSHSVGQAKRPNHAGKRQRSFTHTHRGQRQSKGEREPGINNGNTQRSFIQEMRKRPRGEVTLPASFSRSFSRSFGFLAGNPIVPLHVLSHTRVEYFLLAGREYL